MRMDRCVVAGNGAEAVVTTPGARARGGESLLFGEGLDDGDDLRATNDLGPVVVVHLDHPGAEEEEEEAEAEAEAEGASPGRAGRGEGAGEREEDEGGRGDRRVPARRGAGRALVPPGVGDRRGGGGEEEEDGIEIGYDA